MKLKQRRFVVRLAAFMACTWSFFSFAAEPGLEAIFRTSGFTSVAKAENSAIFHRTSSFTNKNGQVIQTANEITVLGNSIHYFEDGLWKDSEDIIESFPEGAIARRGPHKGIFSHELDSPAVFDLLCSDGSRTRGGVRLIQLTDRLAGQSVVLGKLKANCKGEIQPPNQIVYRSGFDGIDADVVLVWKYNKFSQHILLNQRPVLPAGFKEENAILEIVTEFIEAPVAEILTGRDKPDHHLIQLGNSLIIQGHAFKFAEMNALALGAGDAPTKESVPVRKQWLRMPTGTQILIESADLAELAPLLHDLPIAKAFDTEAKDRELLIAAVSDFKRGTAVPEPMRLASTRLESQGVVIDFEELTGLVYSKEFEHGKTYYIPSGFSVGGGGATFRAGCTIKYGLNAYMTLYGAPVFDTTLQKPVFTARDDNMYGEILPGSDGTPEQSAQPAIKFYFPTFHTQVNDTIIRWAKRGIDYITSYGNSYSNIVQNAVFEECDIGLQPDGYTYGWLFNVTKKNVTTPVTDTGSVQGTMSPAVASTFKGFKGSDYWESATDPPDAMGAVGPDHYLEVINKYVGLYAKSNGLELEDEPGSSFFDVPNSPLPTGHTFDPRVVYDSASQRWFATCVDKGSYEVILAVSGDVDPQGLLENWTRYVIPVKLTGSATDFPTLAVDANGVYIAVLHWHGLPPVIDGNTVVAIKKSDLLNGIITKTTKWVPPVPDQSNEASLYTWCIQPALNYDTPLNGKVWFIAKGASEGTGTAYKGGALFSRRLEWSGNTAVWSDTSWKELPNGNPVYRNYFDIDELGPDINAPQRGGTAIDLNLTGSRFMMSVIRNGQLWTCQHVGLDGTDGDYDGTETGSTVDRSGIHWLKLQVQGAGLNPLLHSLRGMIYDTGGYAPYFYYMPSLMVNSRQDVMVTFSGSRSIEYIGAFYWWQLGLDESHADRPGLLRSGPGHFVTSRWGDYSNVSLDPGSDFSFWAINESCQMPNSAFWRTWISNISFNQ